ncbi:hypothetical protein ATN01_01645 [Buchnera aphidicola (Diuraphis noxia)]|uniref:Outer membrane protein A n=1 Tax=Buchnera aphidicola subsp. Diuraphis noxia TaxID=118101 RepID=A0A1B2H8J5_BUCDN|nr:OmpA family protein [Buchnera aphidicola]ANZ22540.1 hypothetical protein ATN01_01645 [Buchnera aphidicola (Diuraphis noxia)]
MKKRALAIMFLLASLVTSVHSEEQNGWYLGTKMGWSYFNPLKYTYDFNVSDNIENNFLLKENLSAPIFGVFLGYDFNPYFGLEIENNTNGFFPHKIFEKNTKYMQTNSLQLGTKLSYPVTDNFHFYTKLGGMIFWDDIFAKDNLKNVFTKESSLFPSVSLGAEYIFNKKFITRLDYTWKNKVKNIIDLSVKPTLGDAIFSFGWKFGESHVNDLYETYDDDLLTQQNVLNENINFPFNSTDLRPVAYDKLNKLDYDLKKMKLKNISITLSGHSDRIGNKEYNQRLSEDRAYSIKNYLTSRGFSRDQIVVQGMGQLYPLTNQVCKDIKNRSLLISCLAPDRRVEIEVSSDTRFLSDTQSK